MQETGPGSAPPGYPIPLRNVAHARGTWRQSTLRFRNLFLGTQELLAFVTEILRECNLLDSTEEPAYNITLVAASVFNIDAFTRGCTFFHLRVKACGTYPGEYENNRNAWRSFPRYVPELLGHFTRNGFEIIVFNGVPHDPVVAGNVAKDKRHLIAELLGFFEGSNQAARVTQPLEPHRAFLRQIQARTTDARCTSILQEWILSDRLDTLPHVYQHGDFVVNNLGFSKSGLVVFDWEDFGRVSFPGLDLCTLLASDTAFNVEKLRAISSVGSPLPGAYAELLEKSCPLIGLTTDLFRRLVPLYLVLFLDLKRSYGKTIGQIVEKTIHDLEA